jgi:subtilisin family serine protease
MKGIVTKRLNRRIGIPSVNAQKYSPLEEGTVINSIVTITGDTVNGNNQWYKTEEGYFVWSGGVNEIAEENDELEINYWIEKFGIRNIEKRGDGVRIAIIDSGIHLNHVDFNKSRISSKSFLSSSSIQDYYGHGTHCAGIIIGQGTQRIEGVAPLVEAYIARIYYKGQYFASPNRLKDALKWAVSVADVVSISLGINDNDWDSEFQSIIDNAVLNKKLIVCAIGNAFNSGNPIGDYPAKYPKCISVGSLKNNFSISGFTKRFPQLDICLPGENIISTFIDINNPETSDNQYFSLSGSSISTPILAGMLALKKQAEPSFELTSARKFLHTISEEKEDFGYKYRAIKNQKIF